MLRFVLRLDDERFVPVEMRGDEVRGVLTEGDRVAVDGYVPGSTLHPAVIHNLTTILYGRGVVSERDRAPFPARRAAHCRRLGGGHERDRDRGGVAGGIRDAGSRPWAHAAAARGPTTAACGPTSWAGSRPWSRWACSSVSCCGGVVAGGPLPARNLWSRCPRPAPLHGRFLAPPGRRGAGSPLRPPGSASGSRSSCCSCEVRVRGPRPASDSRRRPARLSGGRCGRARRVPRSRSSRAGRRRTRPGNR